MRRAICCGGHVAWSCRARRRTNTTTCVATDVSRVGGLFGGVPDTAWWAKRLQPGDLLFWEHTYKPQRKPPVTHVMVYLGRGERGELLMAGAQNSRGVGI